MTATPSASRDRALALDLDLALALLLGDRIEPGLDLYGSGGGLGAGLRLAQAGGAVDRSQATLAVYL